MVADPIAEQPRRRVGPALAALLAAASLFISSCVGATDAEVAVGAAAKPVKGHAPSSADPSARSLAAGPIPACVAALPLEAKAGQLLMVMVDHPKAARDAVAGGLVGGYTLVTAQHTDTAAEVAAVAATSKLPVFASGDEEGGTVQRLRDTLGPIPAAADLAKTMAPDKAAAVMGQYAAKMKQLGLNMNLGPVLDVGSGSGLGTRSYGDSPAAVMKFGLPTIAAVSAAGVLPVAKHWPGLGAGTADPHLSAAPIAGLSTLRNRDLIPFRRAIAASVPAIMVSHAIVPDLTGGLPASLSRAAITGELRTKEGFDGLVITDSLGMGAISVRFDDPQAAAMAISAGADIALVSTPTKVAAARQAIVSAVAAGAIPGPQFDRSVARVLIAKGITGPCPA